jgi:peptide/nickel transport system ATP-binding protein
LAQGERRQLALARAMAPAPDLLVADEPLPAGDGAPLAELVRAIHAQGTAVLVATRDARPIGAAGVRVLALDAGRLGDGGDAAGRA